MRPVLGPAIGLVRVLLAGIPRVDGPDGWGSSAGWECLLWWLDFDVPGVGVVVGVDAGEDVVVVATFNGA